MSVLFSGVRVNGIASHIPSGSRDLKHFAQKWGEATVERILSQTGIRKVRVAKRGQTSADLCYAAARRLLDELDIAPSQIDALVFVTQTPDYKLPATSGVLAHRLGLGKSIFNFDLNFGCSGFVYGLLQAHLLIHAGCASRVLLCVGDVISPHLSPEDRSLQLVLSDGAAAALLGRGEGQSRFLTRADGENFQSLLIPAGGARTPHSQSTARLRLAEEGNRRSEDHLWMDGMGVMRFALREVPPLVADLLQETGWKRETVSLLGLHQANRFMVEYLRKKIGLTAHQAPFLLENVGNSGPASIPMMLCLAAEKFKSIGDRVLLCGFGAGLSVAAVSLDLNGTHYIRSEEESGH